MGKRRFVGSLELPGEQARDVILTLDEDVASSGAVGGFIATLTGCDTSPTGTARYVKQGNIVTLFIPTITGTSDTTAATLTGLPGEITPARNQNIAFMTKDNGTNGIERAIVKTDRTIELRWSDSATGFTNSGVKGTSVFTITYSLA